MNTFIEDKKKFHIFFLSLIPPKKCSLVAKIMIQSINKSKITKQGHI
jgi:hypothetical protein